MTKAQTIAVRQIKLKAALLEQLKRLPIREVAYEKVGVSRMTCNRWRKTSKKFADEMDAAITTGREFICDLAESQLITLMRQGEFKAVRLFLQYNSPRYANKLELSGNIVTTDVPLTPAEKAARKQAFKFSSLHEQTKVKKWKDR